MSEIKVEKLCARDLSDVLHLLDEVFSAENGVKMDFANKFPRVFKEKDENMGWHYGIRENGELLGVAAKYPFPYRVFDKTLSVAQIGNVAVSSRCRGRGFMQLILNTICRDMAEEGYDMAYLHGERKRYRTFGFERCGNEYVFTMTQSLPKALGMTDDFTFVDMRSATPEEIDEAIVIAKGREHNFERCDAEYIESFTAHEALPLLIKDKRDVTVGYLCYSSIANMVIELGLKTPSDFAGVAVSLLNYLKLQSFQITFAEYENELIGSAMSICRRYEMIQSGNFKILNFDKVTETFLEAKSRYAPLSDGTLVLDTELFGRWSITVSGGKCTVSKSELEPDLYIEGYKVYPFIFGPGAPFAAGVDLGEVSDGARRLIQSWFPLPLYCENFS
jgi:predicted N-acetyltransferase YhbS